MMGNNRKPQIICISSGKGGVGKTSFTINLAAGVGESVLWFNNWAGKNITMLSPDPTAMTDAYALIKIMKTRYNKKDFHLIINNVKSKKEAQEVFANISTVLENFLGVKPCYQGAIPQDSAVAMAVRKQKPFLVAQPKSRASMAVMEICNKILS